MKESVVTFYERKIPRVLALMKAGLTVRSPRLLEPKWKPKLANRPARRTNWRGYVYVFRSGNDIKIGFSEYDVDSRWKALRTANPRLEPPLYVTPPLGDAAKSVEKNAHEALARHRVGGEWFDCSPELAIATVEKFSKQVTS